jgi:oligopeptidase B
MIFAIAVGNYSCKESVNVKPPVATVIPKADTLHGDIRVDNYFWLRDRSNPEVVKYLEAENKYTDAVMEPTNAFQETLYNEILGRIKETDEYPPYRQGDFYYYTRTEKGKQYQIYCRKKGSTNAAEEIYLDPNDLSKNYSYYAVASMDITPDNNFLAFSVDTNGSENYVLFMKNLSKNALVDEKIEHIQVLCWATDNKTLFYTKEDTAHRPYRVYRHTLGAPPVQDALVFEEKDPQYSLGVGRRRSDQFIFIVTSASNSDEWMYIPANKPITSPIIIIPRRTGHEYRVDHWGNYFYIQTNSSARTFRMVRTPVTTTGEDKWEEILPYRKDVTLEGMDFFTNHSVVYEREKGLQKMRVTNMQTGEFHYIEFPDPVYTVYATMNEVYKTNILRFSYQSLTRPSTIYDYNLDTKERKLIKQQEVLGGYNPDEYNSERIYAKASDGVEVPISLVYKKGIKINSETPLHMSGYGAYGSPSQPTFSSNRLSYLNRGIIVAIAHVRGGGDLGKEWYEDGKLLKKMNTFNDFIACAEHLIAKGYTGKEKLTVSGGSAGGLLMGAIAVMRPDLFKAVVAQVPFVDALNTMLDPGLMYTTQEYLEWGNPNEKVYYDYMKSYDPYTNVKARDYTNILVKVGFNDPRVNYWEGTKWVAKLRALKTDDKIILLKVNMGAGHGGSSGRYERLRENAFDYAYILSQYGITK